MPRVSWLMQQLIPPALLTYFGWGAKTCVLDIGRRYIGKTLGYPILAGLYSLIGTTAISSITVVYLCLYFLPANQSVPPFDPPQELLDGTAIFECINPETLPETRGSRQDGALQIPELEMLVNRCWKGRCHGRWKPARARHCSECGVCRAGFDHHCAFFANCLTTPYMPPFILLLTLTPLTVLFIIFPVIPLLVRQTLRAAHLAWYAPTPRIQGWWDWWPSWIVAGGPIGRIVGAVVLGWKELDRVAGEGKHNVGRLEVGVVVGIALMLAMICAALAYNTFTLILAGSLTIDRERSKSLRKALAAIDSLRKRGQPTPPELEMKLAKWTNQHYFFVPLNSEDDVSIYHDRDAISGVSLPRGEIVPTLAGEDPYDHGSLQNWELMMGKGWGWILSWNALKRGMSLGEILNWPISPVVEERLRREAQRRHTARRSEVG